MNNSIPYGWVSVVVAVWVLSTSNAIYDARQKLILHFREAATDRYTFETKVGFFSPLRRFAEKFLSTENVHRQRVTHFLERRKTRPDTALRCYSLTRMMQSEFDVITTWREFGSQNEFGIVASVAPWTLQFR